MKLILNSKRKILFNPFLNLTIEYKRAIIGSVIGNIRRNKTKDSIYKVIENWDFKTDGKLTQASLAKKANLGIATIKRYWKEFKDYLDYLSG